MGDVATPIFGVDISEIVQPIYTGENAKICAVIKSIHKTHCSTLLLSTSNHCPKTYDTMNRTKDDKNFFPHHYDFL